MHLKRLSPACSTKQLICTLLKEQVPFTLEVAISTPRAELCFGFVRGSSLTPKLVRRTKSLLKGSMEGFQAALLGSSKMPQNWALNLPAFPKKVGNALRRAGKLLLY